MKKRRTIKRIKKRHTMKKYKGGTFIDEQQLDAVKNARARFEKKNPFKSKIFNDLTLKTIKTVDYNLLYLKEIKSSYTFSTNGYFINDILKICNNETHRKNYYALCILIRLFYSKDTATTHSYFTLTRNIVENCKTINNIKKQKLLMDTINNNHNLDIKKLLETSIFYDLLKDIMNNTQPIKKLKSMENNVEYDLYSKNTELHIVFNKCRLLKDGKATTRGGAMLLAPMAASMAKTAAKSIATTAYKSMAKEGASIMKQGPKAAYSMLNAATMGSSSKVGELFKKDGAVNPPSPEQPPSDQEQSPSPPDNNPLLYYQDLLEKLFIINEKKCPYMILFILNNILNKINKLNFIHNDIPFIYNNVFCDGFYEKIEEISMNADNSICQNEKDINEIFK